MSSHFVSIVGSTPTNHREMDGIDYEVVPIAHVIGELVDLVDRQIERPVTHFANQMVVCFEIAEMNDGGPMSEMDVIDSPALGQSLESAIDRRRINPGAKPALGTVVQYLGRQVLMTSVRQHLAQDLARSCDPHPGRPKCTDQIDSRRSTHVRRRSPR